MPIPPTLTSLLINSIKASLLHGDEVDPGVCELPSHLLEEILTDLPPLALLNLQSLMRLEKLNEYEYGDDYDCPVNGRKRGRRGNFDAAWKALFKLRWPELRQQLEVVDWEETYWETHLQNCLDEAVELASRPLYDGCIGETNLSDGTLKHIGCEGLMNYSKYLKLYYHCQEFGHYARCLKLRNVLCVPETCRLLRNCKLQSLVIQCIMSEEHVYGLCKLLIQNRDTLRSLDFIHCRLPSSFVNTIGCCIDKMGADGHGIQHFSVKSSRFCEMNHMSLPPGLLSFLSSGRSLSLLKLCGCFLEKHFARLLFDTLIDASYSLSILDLSDNNIAGWLSNYKLRSSSSALSSFGKSKSLQSLCVLNIRGNNLQQDDVESLRYVLACMPKLEILDIGDNPIGDGGIRCLIPYVVDAVEGCSPLTVLNLESCELSYNGVTQFLYALLPLRRSLDSLSIADNSLGSQVAGVLGKVLGTSIKKLNIGSIGLGPAGFEELRQGMVTETKLVEINISKNRGGNETAKFLSKLVPLAPKLVAVNAAYNIMPIESLNIICATLAAAIGQLERVDLTGNSWDDQSFQSSMLTKFQHKGRNIVIFSSRHILRVPHDDDP